VNVVDYLVDSDITTTVNYDKKKKNEQIYFQICESCFWCASCLHLSSEEESKHITKCPYCNVVGLKSLPLTDDKTTLPNMIQ
jgi:Zn finger protein HypA/HybF involved in hydrogenase expression